MFAVKQLITYGLYPAMFFGSMLFGWYGIQQGWILELILLPIVVATIGSITIAERINPQYTVWNKSQKDVKTDLAHLVVSMVLLKKILEALFFLVLFSVSIRLTELIGFSIWPSQLPLFLQLLLAMLMIGFFEYWWHRWAHEKPIFWKLHATHHSPGRLYWLNAARFHPIDTLVSYTITTGPLLILGVTPELLLLVVIWVNVHGLFQHSNIRLKLGPLNWIFSMAELHRWHHSRKLEEANANYGNNIIFWDLVFGTYFFPKDREASSEVGLSGLEKFPQNYVGQLLSPFKWKDIESETD